MKRILAVLPAAVMVFSLTACGSVDTSTGETAERVHQNRIILGDTTELTGDFTGGLITNGASDLMIDRLVNDYGTMVTDRSGNYVENPTVLKSWSRTDHADGTATYTITINDGLVYNNGEPITARDYAFSTLLRCTPFASAMSFTSATQDMIEGGAECYSGEVSYVSGIRLLDEYTLSLTFNADYAQYYYADTYAAVSPWNAEFWLGEGYGVTDNGKGCCITLNGEEITLGGADDVQAHFRRSMSAADGFVSAGPYSIRRYDPATSQCTLEINPNYAGNFEGQKPSIQTIVVVRAEKATWADQLKTGGMDIFSGIAEGSDINTLLDMIDAGAPFDAIAYDRAGYGKIQFLCDVGPTQFVEVRHAVAQLLNRQEFVNTFCQGYGSVVNAPYATAMQMYRDSRDFLADNLNSYPYDVDAANAKLDAGGWTLDGAGGAWTGAGLRYKDVTDLDVNTDGCVEVGGRKLMPLQIRWYSTEGNAVSDLLAIMLANSEAVAASGMEIVQTVGDWNGLMGAVYHENPDGSKVPPVYGMVNMATGWSSAVYDYSFKWTDDPGYVALGYNGNYLFDMGEGGLDDLSMRMVYGVEPGDYEAYLELWQQYILRWNRLLPEIPLYCNIYYTAVPAWVEGYEQNSYWDFSKAIVYASIPGEI